MIKLENITKSYDGVKVFEGLNAEFAKGGRYAVMGPSGCGKTTLFMIMSLIEAPEKGTVIGLDGRKLSVVFQEDRLCENLSLYGNIKIVCDNKCSRKHIADDAKLLGIGEYINKPVSVLSGGMKRRAAILRAMTADFDLLLLDEPFNGLDIQSKQMTADFIMDKLGDRTLIMISHNKEDAELLGCEIINFSELQNKGDK